jgi:NifB/MoaA-like Fe-S oxidoreductase
MYIIAGLKLPRQTYYEDYPQLENGVGMMRLFMMEFMEELRKAPDARAIAPFSVATGNSAAKYLTKLLKIAIHKYGKVSGRIYAVQNEFFGRGVSVSGLITGRDIAAQLKGRELGSRLLIPINMLRRGEDVFLDDMTVTELSETLGVPIKVVAQNGAALLRAFLGE